RAQLGVALTFQTGQHVRVNLAFLDNLDENRTFVVETVSGRESGKVGDLGGRRSAVRGHTAGIDVVHQRLGDSVRIVAHIVFVVAAVFADVIGDNGAAVFQMDGVGQRANAGAHQPYEEDGDT